MEFRDALYGLEFDDDLVFDDKVDATSDAEARPLVHHRNVDLTDEANAPMIQFLSHRVFVRPFKQSRTEMSMDFDRRTDDLPGHSIPKSQTESSSVPLSVLSGSAVAGG